MNAPDPQQLADATKQAQVSLSWWQWLGGGGGAVIFGRLLLSALRRMGWLDGLAASEAKYRAELLAEIEASRERSVKTTERYEARIAALEAAQDERTKEMREALFEAEQATLDAKQAKGEMEVQLRSARLELERLREWDPDRTLPPGLR